MKTLLFVVLTALSTSALAHTKTVSYEEFTFTGDVEYYKFCKAAATNDTDMLRQAIRQKAQKISHNVYRRAILRAAISAERGVKCNETDLLTFALENNSADVYNYIRRKT
ncbi:DUF3718 domain-containing protein [Agaribacter flavus]|uniref:DUF3718 domain-containing protein n=1 Tax=Agaribacter flavus TaxID=1902781 RepID=A0ABV7FLL3_9ALTE